MARPNARLLAMEAPRAAREFGMMLARRNALAKAPKGDGHPVLVLPGLMGGDLSTRAARTFLRRLDYHVHAWQLGRNWGPTDAIIDGLGERFRMLSERHGRPITLIGHSLGGVYSRELARRAPQLVRQVITLGSPVRWREGDSSNAEPVYRTLSGLYSERVKEGRQRGLVHSELDVPLTAIFTFSDGVVSWRNCVVDPGPKQESIEVRGSHSGLIHNSAALLVIADRLAQPKGQWEPFTERRGTSARVWTPAVDASGKNPRLT